jgi:alkyl hydroperoxide reductase subunit AhpC
MVKIGHPVPHFRAPALAGGNLLLLDSTGLRGRSFTLCFLPPLGLLERAALEHRVQDFEAENAFFLGVVDEGALFFGSWQKDLWPRGLTLTADPLGRLSRSFGVSRYQATDRCRSFVIDATGALRYHLVHELNDRGMNAALEILKASQTLSPDQAMFNDLQPART